MPLNRLSSMAPRKWWELNRIPDSWPAGPGHSGNSSVS
jgi:hypothetical protein